ncbi:MAG TPA: peptide-methionine (R)-S-oxide reductase MsrB [Tepidisphaeraceae bacterium]|nr:peptide-methionine (R)-S-oxide reductase MsrB [Tepidisphaeraceae bacterium]
MSQSVPVPASGPAISAAGFDVSPLGEPEVMELAKELNDEERRVLLNHGTEPAFCGNLLDNKKQGTYACRLCGLPLFESKAKFESGTGWPSFFQPVDRAHIAYIQDRSYGMVRTEIRCARCGGHLGHVFPDGPPPTRERYCLNSVSMEFVDAGQPLPRKTRADRAAEPSRVASG